jgi:hypothetical protein
MEAVDAFALTLGGRPLAKRDQSTLVSLIDGAIANGHSMVHRRPCDLHMQLEASVRRYIREMIRMKCAVPVWHRQK